jgi:hypothetical protein
MGNAMDGKFGTQERDDERIKVWTDNLKERSRCRWEYNIKINHKQI